MVHEVLKCHECEKEIATVRCCDCSANLCQACYIKIHSHRILKSHVIDVLHQPGQCPICDHSRWCEKAVSESLPSDCQQCLNRLKEMKAGLKISFEEGKKTLDAAYEQLERDLAQMKEGDVKRLSELYSASLKDIEQKAEKLSALSSHSVPKLCSCQELHEQIQLAVTGVNSALKNDMNLSVTISEASIVDWLHSKVQVTSRQTPQEKIDCCRIVSGGRPLNEDPMYCIARSDSRAGLQLHSLHKHSDLRVGHICEVIGHFGLETLIISKTEGIPFDTEGVETFKLRCRDDASLIVLDVDPGQFSLTSVELLAYDIKLGHIMSVKRDHLLKNAKTEVVSAVPGCIYEPLLDLQTPLQWPALDLFAGTKFCLNGVHNTSSNRCVFSMTFYEPERQRDLSLIDFLTLEEAGRPRLECLQWLESQPANSDDFGENDEVLVVSVKSTNTVFVQTDPEGFSKVEAAVSTVKSPEVLRNPRMGARCLSVYDNVYCRTILVGIVELGSNAYYILYYPDYGNLEIVPRTPSCLRRQPPMLNSFPCTLKRASLLDKKHNYSLPELRAAFENRLVNLVSLKPKVLGVETRLTWVDIAQMRVYIQHRSANVLSSISQGMEEPGEPLMSNNECVGLVQIYSKNRQCFCRGLVENSDGKFMSIRLIDYGDLLSGIMESALRKCPDELDKLPAQARRCILKDASSLELFGMLNKVNENCVLYTGGDIDLWPMDEPLALYNRALEDDPVVTLDWTVEPVV